ncbi:MAG: hypothetical protein ACJ79S_05660 [Gemmatimonadaceae bacterium]
MARRTTGDRVRDALALAVLVVGVALFFYARHNIQLIAAGHITAVPGQSAVQRADRFDRLSRVGLWTAGAGLVLAIAFSIHQHRRASEALRQQ